MLSSGVLAFQQGGHQPAGGLAVPVSLSGDPPDDASLAVDERRGRMPTQPEEFLYSTIAIQEQGEGERERLSERRDRLGLLLEIDAEHLESLVFELPRQGRPGGSLPPAARSASHEKSEDDDAALQIG